METGWSGRAEIGTAGEDGLSVKVSADGSAVQAGPGDNTAGPAALLDKAECTAEGLGLDFGTGHRLTLLGVDRSG